ncbi:MAG: hypothetical protein QXH27_01655 [Candidatus Micrarchaeia archaeon]
MRTTLVLDEHLLARLRQLSHGNISRFVNELLKNCLAARRESMAGVLKGKVSVKDLEALRRGDEKAEREHERLYR